MTTRKVSWLECVLVGLIVFGVIGTSLVFGAFSAMEYLRSTVQSPWSPPAAAILASAAVAATILGIFSWRWIVATRGAHWIRGGLAGMFVGLASHPLCWIILGAYASLGQSGVTGREIGDDSLFFVVMIFGLATFVGLFSVGWLSVPLGALLGAAVVILRSPRWQRPRAIIGGEIVSIEA